MLMRLSACLANSKQHTLMMNNTTSLWPADLDETLSDRRDAKTILEEQAALLPLASAGDINAKVVLRQSPDGAEENMRLCLVLGSRDGYTHELLSVFIDRDLPYPCDLVIDNEIELCARPAALVAALSQALGSESTKSLLLALAVRSQSANPK